MTRWHARKKMMLDMQEHIEGDSVLDLVAQRSGNVVRAVAVMVHRPDREKRRQTLPYRHRAHVITKRAATPPPEYEGDPCCIQEELGDDSCTQPRIAGPKCPDVQEDREGRTQQHGAPKIGRAH